MCYVHIFLQGKISLGDLGAEELAALNRAIAAGEFADAVQPWQPWWRTDEAARLELGSTGTRLVVEVDAHVEAADVGEPVLPSPPRASLPPLSSLTSKTPSPAVALRLLDLLYSYCLVLRLYNGQYNDDVIDAAETFLAASSVLQGTSNGSARLLPGEEDTPGAVLSGCVSHACSSDARQARVPRGFAIGLLEDVACLLEHGRCVVVTALMDLSRLMKAAHLEEAKKDNSELALDIKKSQQKLIFFLSWANEAPPPLYFGLAAQATAVYEEHKNFGLGSPRNEILLRQRSKESLI